MVFDVSSIPTARYPLCSSPPPKLIQHTSVTQPQASWGNIPEITSEFVSLSSPPLRFVGRCWPEIRPSTETSELNPLNRSGFEPQRKWDFYKMFTLERDLLPSQLLFCVTHHQLTKPRIWTEAETPAGQAHEANSHPYCLLMRLLWVHGSSGSLSWYWINTTKHHSSPAPLHPLSIIIWYTDKKTEPLLQLWLPAIPPCQQLQEEVLPIALRRVHTKQEAQLSSVGIYLQHVQKSPKSFRSTTDLLLDCLPRHGEYGGCFPSQPTLFISQESSSFRPSAPTLL